MIRALVFLISCGVTAGLARVQDGGAQTWAIQPTEHFEIHYQSPQRSHVDAVAREAERTYARISLSLRHELAAKMLITAAYGSPPGSQESVTRWPRTAFPPSRA
jgi:hypothetical protein